MVITNKKDDIEGVEKINLSYLPGNAIDTETEADQDYMFLSLSWLDQQLFILNVI